MTANRFVNAFSTLSRGAAVPELPALRLQRARVLSQNLTSGRVSLQLLDRSGDQPDTLPLYLWSGTPGISADVATGQEVLLGYARADSSDPVAFAASPKGQPGHIPIRVRHEASSEILFGANSATVVRVGPAPVPVALGPALQSLIAALNVFATGLNPTTLAAQAATLVTALNAITNIVATRLESE